ncbi:MAG: transglycosylase SLT domain-containing protein [Melioribacteraceae bacterium]|nr:transglycosylase SLT domain-containing protein [Melioribacteraceae bacterium]
MEQIPLKISNNSKHISEPQKIESRYTAEEKKKLAKASMDFESMLTTMMLKSMNQTTNGMFGENNYGGDVFDSLFQMEIASHMTESKSLGIAKQIFEKVTGEKFDPSQFGYGLPVTKKSPELKFDGGLKGIMPSKNSMSKVDYFNPIIKEASSKFGISENIIKSIILTESAGNPKAISKAKAKGLMQLMDGTAKDMGVKNVWDPQQNIFGGTKYFSQMLKKYDGDVELALAAYNAGPGNVDKYNGIPPFDETQKYVKRVLGYLNHLEG